MNSSPRCRPREIALKSRIISGDHFLKTISKRLETRHFNSVNVERLLDFLRQQFWCHLMIQQFTQSACTADWSRLGDLDLPSELLKVGLNRLAPDVVAFAAQVQVVRHDFA